MGNPVFLGFIKLNMHISIYVDSSLHQNFLKSTVYELQRSNGPGKVLTRLTIFVKKKLKKNVGNFATGLHRETAKLLNMAPILPILKILHK